MAHTIREKTQLLNRTRRIGGQVDAIERALNDERNCADILNLIVAARGAMNALMAEVMEERALHRTDAPRCRPCRLPAARPRPRRSAARSHSPRRLHRIVLDPARAMIRAIIRSARALRSETRRASRDRRRAASALRHADPYGDAVIRIVLAARVRLAASRCEMLERLAHLVPTDEDEQSLISDA